MSSITQASPTTVNTNFVSQLLTSRWLVLLLGLNFLMGLGSVPLFDLDEGAFSAATMEMLQRGDYITTYMGGHLRFDKPIFIYWLQAASVSIFGLTEFALRLPSALCATLWCWVVLEFGRQFLDTSKAATAAILLACSLVVSMIARAATADALLNLWIALAMLDSYPLLSQAQPNKSLFDRYALRAYLWVGLGVLAKGPIAIMIPVLSTGLFALLDKRLHHWFRMLFNPVGWIICLSVFLPWYIAEYMAQGQAFIDGFFLKHNLSRFNSTLEGHGGSIFYYLPVSLLVFMPLTGFFLQLISRLRRFSLHADSLDIFCWSWFGFVLIFFSFSNTQLPHYLLYGATPIFILMAKYREQLQSRWLVWLPIALLLIPLIFLPEIGQNVLKHEHKVDVIAMIQDGMSWLNWQYRLSLIIALTAITIVVFALRQPLWMRQIWVAIIFTITITHVVVPTYANIQQRPIQQAGLLARHLNQPVVMWQHNTPSFSVYMQHVVPIQQPKAGDVVFTGLDHLKQYPNAHVLFKQGGIVLLQIPTTQPIQSLEQ